MSLAPCLQLVDLLVARRQPFADATRPTLLRTVATVAAVLAGTAVVIAGAGSSDSRTTQQYGDHQQCESQVEPNDIRLHSVSPHCQGA